MDLLRFDFTCPLCCKNYYTLVKRDCLKQMLNHDVDRRDIFEGYPQEYQNIFTIGFCSKCQKSHFVYDKEEDNQDDQNLYKTIENICTI